MLVHSYHTKSGFHHEDTRTANSTTKGTKYHEGNMATRLRFLRVLVSFVVSSGCSPW